MADDDKKRTQEASETNFTTRGGRQDETSGAGKPWTSPCKRRPETPVDDAATVADSPPTLSNALHTIPALADACSARDLLILSCLSKQTATFAEPVWRRLRDREWPALPGDDAPALKKMMQTLTISGVWRSSEAALVAKPKSAKVLRWEAELRARSDRQAAQDAIDAARKAVDEEPINWRTVRDFKTLSTGEGMTFHTCYPFTESVPRFLDSFMAGGPSGRREQGMATIRGNERLRAWRLRATLAGRRLEDARFEGPLQGAYSPTHVHFPMCRGSRQGTGHYARYDWMSNPAWRARGHNDDPRVDEDEDDRIWDTEELSYALYGDANADMGQELESLRGVRLELDLVRVSDGAVVRLTSGVADGRNGYHIGTEVIWDELVLADPFMRIYAEWQIDFERPEACGLHVRFYDSSINWNGWDGGGDVPIPMDKWCFLSVLERTWALHDAAKRAGVAVRAVPPCEEELAWRETFYAFQLVARRRGLPPGKSELALLICDLTEDYAPPRAPRTATYRVLEYACKSSDLHDVARRRGIDRAMTWTLPDHTLTDAARYLFVAQVRGYRPAFARLYGVREDSSLRRWTSNTKHHLEFRLEPRGLERETGSEVFHDRPLGRFLTVHIIRDDGTVAVLPADMYDLHRGSWPAGWKEGTKDPLHANLHPLCFAAFELVQKGEPAVDGLQLNAMEMIGLGADNVERFNEEVRRETVDSALLRINFKSPPDLDDHCYHVRLGPSPREEFGRNGRTKGGGVLAFIDELFWLEEHWSLPPPASQN